MKIGHVLGMWLCLWTYEAEPAPPGKASFGELSVSKSVQNFWRHFAHKKRGQNDKRSSSI